MVSGPRYKLLSDRWHTNNHMEPDKFPFVPGQDIWLRIAFCKIGDQLRAGCGCVGKGVGVGVLALEPCCGAWAYPLYAPVPLFHCVAHTDLEQQAHAW